MVDNWLISEVIRDINVISNDALSKEYGKFISAIVLWDKIYYPNNEMTPSFGIMSDVLSTILCPINDANHLFNGDAYVLYEKQYRSDTSEVVAQGAIRYWLLSDYYDCDYLPCDKRQIFLKNVDSIELNKRISRINCLKYLDDSIDEYFREMLEKVGTTKFSIRYPVLIDYIVQTTTNEMSYIDRALHLKQEGPVYKYREYLSDMEQAFEKSDFRLLNDMKRYSEELVRNIARMDDQNIWTTGLSIFPMLGVSISKGINIKKRKVRLAFLNELGKFSFNGRKI